MSFERKILRKIHSPKRNENNTYERTTNKELKIMFNMQNIIGIFKSRRISWNRNIWRTNSQLKRVHHNVETSQEKDLEGNQNNGGETIQKIPQAPRNKNH